MTNPVEVLSCQPREYQGLATLSVLYLDSQFKEWWIALYASQSIDLQSSIYDIWNYFVHKRWRSNKTLRLLVYFVYAILSVNYDMIV